MYDGNPVSFSLLIMIEYEVWKLVPGDVRFAIENPRLSLPYLTTSDTAQLPRLAYCGEERYFVPTAGMSAGLVNCQSATTTTMMRRIEVRIFPFGPKTAESLFRNGPGSLECY